MKTTKPVILRKMKKLASHIRVMGHPTEVMWKRIRVMFNDIGVMFNDMGAVLNDIMAMFKDIGAVLNDTRVMLNGTTIKLLHIAPVINPIKTMFISFITKAIVTKTI